MYVTVSFKVKDTGANGTQPFQKTLFKHLANFLSPSLEETLWSKWAAP